MADPIIIEAQSEPTEAMTFRIRTDHLDEEFKWTPVKTGGLLVAMRHLGGDDQLAGITGFLNTIYHGLDESDHDRLDITITEMEMSHVMQLIEALIEVVTARPTRSDSG